MKIHHLNCMSYTLGVPEITHCLLIETNDGLVLVDTGLGTQDYTNPSRRVKSFMRFNKVLQELARQHGDEIKMFCSHDPVEFKNLREGSINVV